MKKPPPHIILFLSDQHRGQAMAHLGDSNLLTPNMDKMAKGGVSFERAYTNCPVCTPARGTIFSGRHAHSGPVQAFTDTYSINSPSLATILRENGYHTAYFGKWHCGIVKNQKSKAVKENINEYSGNAERTPERHRAGFQDWNAYECTNQHYKCHYYHNDEVEPRKVDGYCPDEMTKLALDYIKNYDKEEPLFLVLSVNTPHFNLEAPEKWKRHNGEELTVRDNFDGSHPVIRKDLALYYDMIENLDWNMGRVLNELESNSKFKNTMTTYISDHGEFMGSHGRGWAKSHPEEESVRIPAIFNWNEKIPAKGNTKGLFSLVDFVPTVLGTIGIDVPVYCQGESFAPLLQGEKMQTPESVLIEMHGNPHWKLELMDWRGLVTEDWKYAFYENGEELLFDLKGDPYEQNNLSKTDVARCTKMRELLLVKLKETREPFFDVIIEHGVSMNKPDMDSSKS